MNPNGANLPLTKTAEAVLVACRAHGLTMATAESCTGGRIAGTLTACAGASEVFVGGLITYSNEMKETLLGVDHALLEQFGAVSEPVAEAMARGAKRVTGADIAVAVTGIAGPGGGSPDKPVGLVYTSVATDEVVITQENHFSGSREAVRDATILTVLEMILHCFKLKEQGYATTRN